MLSTKTLSQIAHDVALGRPGRSYTSEMIDEYNRMATRLAEFKQRVPEAYMFVPSDMEGIPGPGEVKTDAWSDEARAAAIEARREHMKDPVTPDARQSSKVPRAKSKRAPTSGPNASVENLAENATRKAAAKTTTAVESGRAGDHEAAAEAHDKAAEAHGKVAFGDPDRAVHEAAAASHRAIASDTPEAHAEAKEKATEAAGQNEGSPTGRAAEGLARVHGGEHAEGEHAEGEAKLHILDLLRIAAGKVGEVHAGGAGAGAGHSAGGSPKQATKGKGEKIKFLKFAHKGHGIGPKK